MKFPHLSALVRIPLKSVEELLAVLLSYRMSNSTSATDRSDYTEIMGHIADRKESHRSYVKYNIL